MHDTSFASFFPLSSFAECPSRTTGLTVSSFSVMGIFPLEPDERLEFHLKLSFPVSVNVTELECGFSFCHLSIKGVV